MFSNIIFRNFPCTICSIILYPINSSNGHSSYVPRDRPIYSGIGSKKSVFFPYWTVEYKCTKQLFYNDKSRYREKVSECTIIDSHRRYLDCMSPFNTFLLKIWEEIKKTNRERDILFIFIVRNLKKMQKQVILLLLEIENKYATAKQKINFIYLNDNFNPMLA